MGKRVSKRTKDLKKNRWHFWKASQLRANWRSRCKKIDGDLESVPTRQEIEDWLHITPLICYLTGEDVIKSRMEVDHKNPISTGGSYLFSNLGITSKRLNSAKGNMSEKEFKGLLKLIFKWEDKGKQLLNRLIAANNVFRGRRR